MQLRRKWTYEEQSDDIPFPIGYTKCAFEEDTEADLLCIWWLTPFVYPYYIYLRKRRQFKRWLRRRDVPPPDFKRELLAQVYKEEANRAAAEKEAVLNYTRNLPPDQ